MSLTATSTDITPAQGTVNKIVIAAADIEASFAVLDSNYPSGKTVAGISASVDPSGDVSLIVTYTT